MDERVIRAATLGHRLARLLRAIDPDPMDEFLAVPIRTPDDTFLWTLTVSEAGVEQLTGLLEEFESRQWGTPQPTRRFRVIQGEAS